MTYIDAIEYAFTAAAIIFIIAYALKNLKKNEKND
jgi:hypothetical protein